MRKSEIFFQMQKIFHNNKSGPAAYTGDLNTAEIHDAITLHPLKQPDVMRKLHLQIRRMKSSDLRYRALQLIRDQRMAGVEILEDPGIATEVRESREIENDVIMTKN